MTGEESEELNEHFLNTTLGQALCSRYSGTFSIVLTTATEGMESHPAGNRRGYVKEPELSGGGRGWMKEGEEIF